MTAPGLAPAPVDLARERRVRRRLDRLAALLNSNPGLAARTRAALAGRLPWEERTMPRNVNLRMSDAMLARLARLRRVVRLDGALRRSQSAVVRLAVARGLDALEAEYAGELAELGDEEGQP